MAQWRRIPVTCLVCGQTVIKNNKAETCSLACREALKRRRLIEASPVEACPVCGEVTPLWRTAKGTRVCSERCKGIVFARGRRQRDWGAWRRAQPERQLLVGSARPCDYCATDYTVKRYDQRFCSRKCFDRWRWNIGEKGPKTRAAQAVLRSERAASIGSCALCGVPHERIVPARDLGVTRRNASGFFHLDHILPRAHGGTDDPTNVRYLCWFCNLARFDVSHAYDAAVAAAGRAFWAEVTRIRSG